MRTVVRSLGFLRRTARAQLAFLFAGAFAGLIAAGSFRPAGRVLPWTSLAALVVWGLFFTRAAWHRFREDRDAADVAPAASERTLRFLFLPRLRLDLELGALLLVLTLAIVEFTGGARSALHPLLYVVVAFFVSFYPRMLGIALTLAAAALDAVLILVRYGPDRDLLVVHGVFIGFFALLNLVFTHTEIFRLRHRGEMRLRHALARVREAARDFRLTEAPAPASDGSLPPEDGTSAERRLRDPLSGTVAAVHQIQETLFDTLDLLRQSLSLHSCAVLLVDRDRASLKLAEIATEAEEIECGPFGVGDGVAGAAMRTGGALTLGNLRPDYRGLPYYRGPIRVGSFLAVPFRDGEDWRGVLVVDRLEPDAFGGREQKIIVRAAERVARTIQNERAFLQLERTKREQGQLLEASERLSNTIREDDVETGAIEAARAIVDFDFAALVTFDERTGRHQVRRAAGHAAADVAQLAFDDNQSLVAIAVRTRHYLPYRGDFDDRGQVVFVRRGELPGMNSLLVLPLVVGESALGALVLAARRNGAFRDDVRPLLQVLANQVASSLLNARMVRRLAELATTDQLTGLANRRTFDGELERQTKSAERYRKPLSLIMCDVDHFKKVNDTYGHSVGDVVLKAFGQVLLGCKRDLDVVARYGGEEFVVLCEETDTAGAKLLAERIRKDLAARTFAAEQGPFHVTCSLGVATFPLHASDKARLVQVADELLYKAKQAGRNRTVAA
ncbi:MAG: diguanylate cyclase [Deltaproteobacteria bacterium]|nr:diguanylate cyclase [Deltaproteobacteria bacterium]